MTARRTTVVRRREVNEADPDVVVVDRSTRWGNRYTHSAEVARKHPDLIKVPGRHAACVAHRIDLLQRMGRDGRLVGEVRALQGMRLACHCAPLPCHADTLAELADMDIGRLRRLIETYAEA